MMVRVVGVVDLKAT